MTTTTRTTLARSMARCRATTSSSLRSMSTALEVPYDFSENKRPIYVAATRQHVGKTSTSVALLSGLQKRFDRVGFIKPVGQQCMEVYEQDQGCNIKVDKDVALLKQHFGLDHLPYRYMSPVLIPRGYTKDYLDGKISNESQQALVQDAFEHINARSDVVLCEGTGHCAVGSIVGAGNAKVASWIGADMVLVANGGLGKAFDELELNRILCLHHGVNVAGVVINKVKKDKYEQTKHYLGKALERNWGIPLLGCIPDRPFLGCPALADLERLFGSTLLCGEAHRFRHYTIKDLNLVATSLAVFLHNLRVKPSRTLYVCHASRHDILLGFIGEYQRRINTGEPLLEAALVVCGRPDKYEIRPELRDMMVGLDDAPILMSPYSTRETMEMIHSHTPKLNADDEGRVNAAVSHYEPYIDFDLLLERTGNSFDNAKSKVFF